MQHRVGMHMDRMIWCLGYMWHRKGTQVICTCVARILSTEEKVTCLQGDRPLDLLGVFVGWLMWGAPYKTVCLERGYIQHVMGLGLRPPPSSGYAANAAHTMYVIHALTFKSCHALAPDLKGGKTMFWWCATILGHVVRPSIMHVCPLVHMGALLRVSFLGVIFLSVSSHPSS